MRNLLRLLGQYHMLMLFLVTQGFALSWYAASHGHPRGQWVRTSLAVTGAWDAQRAEIAALATLDETNAQLAAENAKLLAASLSEGRRGAWNAAPAVVIRSTTNVPHNVLVLEKRDLSARWKADQGLLAGGHAAGRILEVEGHYALGVPLISVGMEWSGRVRRDGPEGRIRWDGVDPGFGNILDIPRSAQIFPGDTIFTTGFQGIFPPDVPIGTVVDNEKQPGSDFVSLRFAYLTDFRSLRHLSWVQRPDAHLIDSLLNTFNSMTWTE